MKNWYRKACANNRFWDIWERHDTYSAVGLPIYISKTDYGNAAVVMDFERGTAYADVYPHQKSAPVAYRHGELRFGNTYETTTGVDTGSRVHSALFTIEPQVVPKLAALDSDKSLWWFMYMRMWLPEDGEPALAGTDDLAGTSKFGDEIVTSMSHDLKKWASCADWERVDRFLVNSQGDFMRTLMRASTEAVEKLGSSLVDIHGTAPRHLASGDAYLADNWENMKRRHARALAAVAARGE